MVQILSINLTPALVCILNKIGHSENKVLCNLKVFEREVEAVM